MADPEGWEVWDDRRSDRRRDREPNSFEDEPERKPLGAGWLIGLIFGGLLLLGIVGVAFYWLLDDDFNPPPPPVMVGPGGPPIVGPGPGLVAPPGGPNVEFTPVGQDTRQEITKLLKSLGQEITRPDYDPTVHFDMNQLASNGLESVPLEPRWGQSIHLPELGTPPVDRMLMTRASLRYHRSNWRRWDWTNLQVVKIHTSDILGMQAIVRYPQPSGPPVRLIWTFSPNPVAADNEFVWKISGWQDLTTGLGAEHLIAQQMIQRGEQRYDLYVFSQLNYLYQQIDEGEFEAARNTINRMYQTRPVGVFRDLTELADAKLRLRTFDVKNAVVLLNEVNDRNQKIDSIHAIRAEAAARGENWDQAVTFSEEALKRFGDDPLVLSQLGTALIALNKQAEARPHLVKALRLDPDNVAALNGFRKVRTAEETQVYANAVRASTRFPKVFQELSQQAFNDQDWRGLEILARENISRRADESLGHVHLIRALANQNQLEEAFEHYYQVAPQFPNYLRTSLLDSLVRSSVDQGETVKTYATVPEQWKEPFFAAVTQQLENRYRFEQQKNPDEVAKAKRQLRELSEVHAVHYPKSPSLLLTQARELIAAKKWDEAGAKLDMIPRKPRDTNFEYDPLEFPRREARLTVWFHQKNWDTALSDKTDSDIYFQRLANLCVEEKDLDRLESLLAVAEKKSFKENWLVFWKGTLLTERGKHAEALVEYRKILKVAPAQRFDFDDDDEDDGRYSNRYRLLQQFTLSAVKAKQAPEAVKVLQAEEYVSAALFAYALISAGEEERALRYLATQIEDEMAQANIFYTDANLGPLLKQPKPLYAQFRARFPAKKLPVDEDN